MKPSTFNARSFLKMLISTQLFLLMTFGLLAQTISGTVYDACIGTPLAGATISIQFDPPIGPPMSYTFKTKPDGTWDFSFFASDPDVPYHIYVLGGASSPTSYVYYRKNGDQSGFDFSLLQKQWDITINGEEISWQNNPQSPLTLCRNMDNCLKLTGLEGDPFVPRTDHCFQVRLYDVPDAGSGNPGVLLASSFCDDFVDRRPDIPCGDEAFDLNELFAGLTTIPPLMRLEVWHFCCNRECNPGETDLLNKEVVFIEVLNEVQLGFQFTAGDFIDEINGPPTDDGLVPGSTQLPGPFLGAATIGLNIGAFSDDGNVLSWQYTIEEVDCNTGASVVTLYTSPVDDDGGPLPENETFIDKYIGPPGQEVQGYFPLGTGLIPGVNYTDGKCYKVTLNSTTVCGEQEVFSYFQIQQYGPNNDPCPFCIIAPPGNGTLSQVAEQHALGISPNPTNGRITLTVLSEDEAFSEFSVYDLNGREVVPVFKGMLEKGRKDMTFDLSALPRGIYVLKGRIGDRLMSEKIIVQ